MKLIYIDESGNTGTRSDDALQPYHLIAALVVDDYVVRLVEDDIRMLGLKHCGEVSRNTDFEFHGYEIHKGKGRYFSKLDELSAAYISHCNLNLNLFLGWSDWVEQYATLRQKTELRHLSLLAHNPLLAS